MIFATTPSQTVGPYFAIGLPWAEGPLAVPEDTPGAIRITGVVYDGAGAPVPDALPTVVYVYATSLCARTARATFSAANRVYSSDDPGGASMLTVISERSLSAMKPTPPNARCSTTAPTSDATATRIIDFGWSSAHETPRL